MVRQKLLSSRLALNKQHGKNRGGVGKKTKTSIKKSAKKVLTPGSRVSFTTSDTNRVIDAAIKANPLVQTPFSIGSNTTIQVGQVNFHGTRSFSFEGLMFTRTPKEDPTKEDAKPFKFNLPINCFLPLRNSLSAILYLSGREKRCCNKDCPTAPPSYLIEQKDGNNNNDNVTNFANENEGMDY